jgi:hypothetical protein
VVTGRGKKGKKAGWHLTLGLKEIIFGGIGVASLMMMSFALGALAGRGDIYRAACDWGLMSPEKPRVAQWTPVNGVTGEPAAAAPTAPGEATAPLNSVPVAHAPAPALAPVAQSAPAAAASPQREAPIAGSIAPLAPPVTATTAKKKGKAGATHHDNKSREEELKRVRQEVAQKLKFQNSFDTLPKARLPKPKEHDKVQVKSGEIKSPPTQVQVAQYRNSKEAQAKMAELHKKGIKATLKKTKDAKGTWYLVYKPESSPHTGSEKLAKKPEKSTGSIVRKPKIE